LVLPIFKGGNYPGAMSVFIFATALIFLISVSEFFYQRDKYWLLVWVGVSLAVLIHAFIYPLFFVNERFFIDELSPQIAAQLNSRQLSKMRMLEVWSFFTSMWLLSWRVSLLALKQVRALLLLVFVASLFQASFGLVHFISGSSSVMGLWVKEFYLNDATGTFVNRNHFSGMLAVSFPLVVSAILMPKPLVFSTLSKGFRIIISLLYLLILTLALISSNSRMGIVAAIFGGVVCFFFMSKIGGLHQRKINTLKLLLVFFFLILFAVWFGLGDILQRYTELSDGNSRFDVWKAMFEKVPFQVWLFGAGPGSFESVFQVIKPSNFSVRFIYAHNDYLEVLFEFGVILTFFILCTLFYWVKYYRGKVVVGGYMKAGVYGSIAAISLHSLVDFNLQVPASAMFFWIAVGFYANPIIASERSEGVSVSQVKQKSKRTKFKFPKNKREWLQFLQSD